MSQESASSVEGIRLWRNVLDALGQLSAAWDIVERAQHESDESEAWAIPAQMLTALTQGATAGAHALTGLAGVLAGQPATQPSFEPVARAQQDAEQHWASAQNEYSQTSRSD